MNRPKRGWPQELRPSESQEQRILRILCAVPTSRPRVEILPYTGEPFEVEYWEGSPGLPLEEGASCVEALYYPIGGHLMEASFHNMLRRVRLRKMWSYEVYTTGGAYIDDQFHICWGYSGYYRKTAKGVCSIDLWRPERPCTLPAPNHLPADYSIHWLDGQAAEGPTDEGSHFAGYATVRIGDNDFDCLQMLAYWEDKKDPDDPNSAHQSFMAQAFINRNGLTVLARKYASPPYTDERDCLGDVGCTLADMKTRHPELAEFRYNDVELLHWFDLITSAGFGV